MSLIAFLSSIVLRLVSGAGYNETAAIQYAHLAGAAYCDAAVLKTWSRGSRCLPGMKDVHICNGLTTRAYAGHMEGKCIVSFQGTNGLSSVKVDLEFSKANWGNRGLCDGCELYAGFLAEWESLKHCVQQSLTRLQCGDAAAEVHATGHSLGGAVAAIAMFDFRQRGWSVGNVYTFGMPRVGNAAFAASFNSLFHGRFFRVTHSQDPFVDFPPRLSGYVSLEPEVFYKGGLNEGYTICNTQDDQRCSGQFFPEYMHMFFAKFRKLHLSYLDVTMAQTGCVSAHKLKCTDDIPESWCKKFFGINVIPCNANRGTAYCDGATGKCACNPGSCPVDGTCKPQEPFKVRPLDKPHPDIDGTVTAILTGTENSASVWIGNEAEAEGMDDLLRLQAGASQGVTKQDGTEEYGPVPLDETHGHEGISGRVSHNQTHQPIIVTL